MQRQGLPIRPRTATLIIGASGTGKSHLARAIAKELGAAFLKLSVSDWVLLGCSQRGAETTWPMIYRFLRRNAGAEGLVIFLDEVDKISGTGTWETFLRTEVFALLDLQIPVGIRESDNDDDEDDESSSKRAKSDGFNVASRTLRTKTLILAAGAFQHIWENQAKPALGFGEPCRGGDAPSLNDLAATLPRELVNRFRSDIVILPQLAAVDYEKMLAFIGDRIPPYLRSTFIRMGKDRLPHAVKYRQGCRFVEELLLDVIIAEREAMHTNTEPSAGIALPTQLTSGDPTL